MSDGRYELLRRLYEAINRRDLETLASGVVTE
jgi:hypothetical protein